MSHEPNISQEANHIAKSLNTKNNINPQIKSRNVINPYYSYQKHISTLSPNQTIPEVEGGIKTANTTNPNINITYTAGNHNKSSTKSLRKKKTKNCTRTNEHIIYDPSKEGNPLPKKSSSEEKKRNPQLIRPKSKKRESTHGEVKKMLTTHFLKPSFMRTACSPENSSSLSMRKHKNNLTGITTSKHTNQGGGLYRPSHHSEKSNKEKIKGFAISKMKSPSTNSLVNPGSVTTSAPHRPSHRANILRNIIDNQKILKDKVCDLNRSHVGKSDDDLEGSDILEKNDKMLMSLKKKIFNSIQKSHKNLISGSSSKCQD